MRGIVCGEYSLDLGRKELYDRLPEVRSFLFDLLGDDYCPYDHRVGILYDGVLLEYSRRFRSVLRGAPPRLLSQALVDLLVSRLTMRGAPENLEEALLQKRGATLTRAFSQGYQEKFSGIPFRERPPPLGPPGRARMREEKTQFFHPRRGTQQIVDALVRAIAESGGEFLYGAELELVRTRDDRVTGVFVRVQASRLFLAADTVISAVPILTLARALGWSDWGLERASWHRKRVTLLGYFLLSEPVSFPHAWLLVSCGKMRTARLTNYAGFGGQMVPKGKGAIAAEIFVDDDDPYHQRSDEAILDAVERELSFAGVLAPRAVTRRFLIRIPGAEAASDYRNWTRPAFLRLGRALQRVEGLYETNRAGVDIAMYAGMEAARAILDGAKMRFIESAAPTTAYDDFSRISGS